MTRTTTWTPASGTGVWSVLGAAAAEAVSHGNPGWIGLDAQHGFYDDQSMRDALRAVTAADVLVRVRSLDAGEIGRALDAGARGVIVPMIECAESAARAAAAVRYPPVGSRSWGPFAPYWGRAEVGVEEANRHVVCGVMVETRAGLDRVDEIAATPGVDMVFVGPYDLALSLGVPLDDLVAGDKGELRAVVSACRAHDVIPGVYAGSSARARQLAGMGFEVLAARSDRDLLIDGVGALG
ncbi:aldolase/citrate lyase family protein [Streptomyces spinosirectus]|uniref:HpcH/HpaI aldolase family protein n=1 Tax=Streptomyces TaxID=1883 RepID=UPI001C9E17E0|nr:MULTISPECIES: aldolase/citrate lyase family protein [Streptomyces]MBY8341059.1 aldolase [Streptomyces plumbidurans]UIR22330.1 aldolase/citrate lyase family protein [Streptomyces spinosirectus]